MSDTATPTINCQKVVSMLWDYLDGRLPDSEMTAIADHLAGCLGCRSHAEFERALLDHIGGTRREPNDLAALESRVRLLLGS